MSAHVKPSFSRYLRTFAKLGPVVPEIDLAVALQARRSWKENRRKKLIKADLKNFLSQLSQDASRKLTKLKNVAKEIVGTESGDELAEETVITLLEILIGNDVLTNALQKKLGTPFGHITPAQANCAFQAVKDLSSDLSPDQVEQIKAICSGSVLKSIENTPVFGDNIKVAPPEPWPIPDFSRLQDMTVKRQKIQAVDNFSMQYKQSAPDRKQNYGMQWIIDQVECWCGEDFMGGIPSNEVANSLAEMLKSYRSNDELQEELLDMLGFEKIELAQILLEKRALINEDLRNAATCLENAADKKRKPPKDLKYGMSQAQAPTLACQVTVQREDERLLMKQIRKEEKKMHKAAMKNAVESDSDEEEQFDPEKLRAARIAQLTAVQKKGLFGPKKMIMPSRPAWMDLPNVYDSQNDARQTAGFITNMKMLLPENVTRKDTKEYEQVDIPISKPVPLTVGEDKVKISSLDELGQAAFNGIESLNRIQSVVFDTAYNTNENLLICAPTGAGKTNVALLTVMNVVRQYYINDRIELNKFKIVYIAPMKALAAEMAKSFQKRLIPFAIKVRELTGDMNLTKKEIEETQMLITTPEKWDVVSRKSNPSSDVELTELVRLIIIDEVHLLHGDRGPVLEAIVARTLRMVETTQRMVRIVGLSATLPNYLDVAFFLRVNLYKGLFYFDHRFRPVPLSMSFVGIKARKSLQQMNDMDDVCYDKVLEMVEKGHQVMVFVHARNATVRTAQTLQNKAQVNGQLAAFEPKTASVQGQALRSSGKLQNKQLAELMPHGFAVHHAGMPRRDRNLVEQYFAEGFISVLVCTSTLAWGVNLPAHAVIIKGTEIYDAKHGTFVDLGILDVLQIFGRAGRPQFDKSGHGCIITSHEKLNHYLSLLTNQYPIESQFVNCLADNLNAEVVLGTISSINDAIEWLKYSYLYVRMRKNPMCYGVTNQMLKDDPELNEKCRELIVLSADKLQQARMVRFHHPTGSLDATDIGRTASYFYIKYDTMQMFVETMNAGSDNNMTALGDADIVALMSQAQEFEQLKLRDDEMDELDELFESNCYLPVAGGPDNIHGKVNILLQTYLSKGFIKSFSLISDKGYVTDNAARIARALFDLALKHGDAILSNRTLKIAKMMEKQMWDSEHPLAQIGKFGMDVLDKLQKSRLSLDRMREMSGSDIGAMVRNTRLGPELKQCVEAFPSVAIDTVVQPITATVVKISVTITPTFKWNDHIHGKTAEVFWLWIEDCTTSRIHHYESVLITKKQVRFGEQIRTTIMIPLNLQDMDYSSHTCIVRVVSDRWLHADYCQSFSFKDVTFPDGYSAHTDLLDLDPLPISALNDPKLESLFGREILAFNAIQTQVFHCLYHTDENVVLGAATGSGKTVVAELAMFRVFKEHPNTKVVYIAPLKALVRERIKDWNEKLVRKLGKKVIELTGDSSPDAAAIASADVVVTTPEKWDGVSRSWQTRNYVRQVSLLIIDEIHLLGEDRGPVLEVIVSRASYIAAHSQGGATNCRVVGLSTALANADDLAAWLGISTQRGLYNFRPSVRPVPVQIHISGFPGKHFCPRMATMNKPTFQAIRTHSPDKPALVFVASRRQTRLTAMALLQFQASDPERSKDWLGMSEEEAYENVDSLNDPNLKLLIPFGIGIHHAGLQDRDRSIVEELFVTRKIRVLVTTATLAWGVNFPAHLVVVKGTEYFDGKKKRYEDMPITDVLQMIGRAGRPQYDDQAVAVLLVQDIKKAFYKRFLHEPFPVESKLLAVLPDHLNAEIVAGTIQSKQDAMDYLTWTFFFRRLLKNPTYYGLVSLEAHDINMFLSSLVEKTVIELSNAGCVMIAEDGRGIMATSLGRISSFYYISYKTIALFDEKLHPDCTPYEIIQLLSNATEYDELPVRHNEDNINGELMKQVRVKVDGELDNPHLKTNLLIQAYLLHLHMPSTDYNTDLKSVLDQCIRILQAMLDVSAEKALLSTTITIQLVLQSIIQAKWPESEPLWQMPFMTEQLFREITVEFASDLPTLVVKGREQPDTLRKILKTCLPEKDVEVLQQVLKTLPAPGMRLSINGYSRESQSRQASIRLSLPCSSYTTLSAGQTYVICLTPRGTPRATYAFAPHFPRKKDIGWFVILGMNDPDGSKSGTLLGLKRIPASDRTTSIEFETPSRACLGVLSLYLISNCYMGLDQQYQIPIAVIDDAPRGSAEEEDLPERPKPTSITIPSTTLLQAFKEGPEKVRYFE
ncbi:activating signal cointegrator 1 complex subunit 3 [Neocloeon triangulifer]|uniref:activating signal cointegrator 1 complex subunit 3 n=1 Tax=Neocloeon triangulifer TaxID=2078957 RepID=UPI00286EBC99|nr:activating signal cointegrator 1 complex subunit 3 [Neocloeon triangulifer]